MTPDSKEDCSMEELARDLREHAIEEGDEDVVTICNFILGEGGSTNDD